jgi:hypothetical protein
MTFDPASIRTFRYDGFDLDPTAGELACHYGLGELRFTERITFATGGDWTHPAVRRAARLVFLLAGVSYYKAAAPPEIDLGGVGLTPAEAALLRSFYVDGLGEYAYRNELDVSALRFVDSAGAPTAPVPWPHRSGAPGARPLVPFGGGIDSIVTVELVRERAPDAALFVVSRAGARFDAIEAAAARTGLPVVRAARELDPQILASRALGFRNGHVPVTGILSVIAVMAAALDGRDAVVMSNEWSASQGNVAVGNRVINHQFSKSYAFESLLRRALRDSFDPAPEYFSRLRPFSELRIAERFATLRRYHPVFRSCNRAFPIDRAQRLDTWCGQCDKCCFIDLILAPFLPATELEAIFAGSEPLADPARLAQFRTLLALTTDFKPFECVGDVDECRAATLLAAARPDRAANPVLARLAGELGPSRDHILASVETLLRPIGEHFIPPAYATDDLLV